MDEPTEDRTADDRPRLPRQQPGHPPGKLQSGPFLVRCPAGRYAYCQCQQSTRYPYCDGSHRTTPDDALPENATNQPLKLDLETERTIAWCACGRSGQRPFCDGSHAES